MVMAWAAHRFRGLFFFRFDRVGLHLPNPSQHNRADFVERILRAIADVVRSRVPINVSRPRVRIIKVDDIAGWYFCNVV